MIKILIKAYIIYALLLILHETAHFCALKRFRVCVYEINFGVFPFIRFGKIKISPILISGSTIFSRKDFKKNLSIKR